MFFLLCGIVFLRFGVPLQTLMLNTYRVRHFYRTLLSAFVFKILNLQKTLFPLDIIRLNGTEKKLYEIVAPLVMNPAIIRQNNNYPFKTSNRYTWYIAFEEKELVGFMPVKKSDGRCCIDNYYIQGDRDDVIDGMLAYISGEVSCGNILTAIVHKRHVKAFARNGFGSFIEWTKYDKMEYNTNKTHGKTAGCL